MKEFFQYFDLESDAERTDWVVRRCVGPKNTLHSIIPAGFESYIRILHPAWAVGTLDPDDVEAWRKLRAGWREAEDLTPVRWDKIASENKFATHRSMQWWDIGSHFTRERGHAGIDPPDEGALTPEIMDALFETFIEYSDENQDVLCGIWNGCVRIDNIQKAATFHTYSKDDTYILFNTSLAGVRDGWLAAFEDSLRNHGIGTSGLAPNLVWPATQEWCLVVNPHLHSSYVGGPTDLINSIRDISDLETYEALIGDTIF